MMAGSEFQTPAKTAPEQPTTPDSNQLVERLQALKARLSNMARTLEESVAAASPMKNSAEEEIVYSTPKLVKQLLESDVGQDSALFLAKDQTASSDQHVTEIRFTISAQSEEEIAEMVKLLESHGQ
mmetsp:Transcript_54395/g.127176  ORF Transcript_54395/g.127176 Transcript_54395/m.127176 type:complete len:126 (+) Transcript_54395:218-595(+)